MPATERHRLAFRDRFRSLHAETFQTWIEELLSAIHAPGDFQAIRKTSGDGGIDGLVLNSSGVYQVYAPARIHELRDAETASKIERDFLQANRTLDGSMRAWTFIHNHPEGKLGKESVTVVARLTNRSLI